MGEQANGLKGLKSERLKYILISLILLVALYPMIERGGLSSRILNLFFTLILVTTIYVTSSSGRRLIVSLCIGIPWMLAGWANTFFQNPVMITITGILLTVFSGHVAYTILSHVLSAKKVTRDIICGALSIYLLLGLTWVGGFLVLETLQPGSFAAAGLTYPETVLKTTDFIYYSFVTLTTLGYGDIVPVTARARSLAILEAITGVLFSAVLIARLVGMQIVHMTDTKK